MVGIAFKYEDIMKNPKKYEPKGSPDVHEFVLFALHILKDVMGDYEKDPEALKETGKYLTWLYNQHVWDATDFKRKIPLSNHLKIQIKDKIFCDVVRGTKTVSVSSEILVSDDNADKKVMVLTYNMLCAVTTICMSLLGVATLVKPAKLAANIFRNCKINECRKHNWGVHGHYGMKFVASYCYVLWKKERDAQEGNKVLEKCNLPTMESFFMVAYRMDRNRAGMAELTRETVLTLSSLVRSTGVDADTIEDLAKQIPMEDWPVGLDRFF